MRKTSFWTAIFWLEVDLPALTKEEFCLSRWGGLRDEIEVVGRRSTAERLARRRLRELNQEMLHSEDYLWRYKLVELKGGKRK